MSSENLEESRKRVASLVERGDVEIAAPDSLFVGPDVELDQIESGVSLGPGVTIRGSQTVIGAGTSIAGAAYLTNCLVGRNCSLQAGEYLDSVLMDGCSTVGWARVRGNSAWEEGSGCAHNCDTKTTVLGYKTTLGSLINFCNVLMLGGTSPRLEVGAEVGSGVINFNFLPFGPTVGALIKPSTVIGSIESPFLSCAEAPVRYDFIGGHTSIIGPVAMGLNCMVAAKTRINPGIYGDDVLIAGGNLQQTRVVEVSRVRELKDIRPKYEILTHQLGTTLAFRRWCDLRIEWSEEVGQDTFEITLIKAFASKVDHFLQALIDYGDNIAKYILSRKDHSRPESLESNTEKALLWKEEQKEKVQKAREIDAGYEEETAGFRALIKELGQSRSPQFYEALSQCEYSHQAVNRARDYFCQYVEEVRARLENRP